MPTVEEIAAVVTSGAPDRQVLVAVDGGDASGKTTYAALLADAIRDCGRTVSVVHVDDVMHPPEVRHRRGRTSPEGYLDDSYDYDALLHRVRSCTGQVVVVEGLFLHRDELVDLWDHSVFLDVPLDVALERK